MRVRWKLVGLAGLAGVAGAGVVLARSRRAHRDYDAEELRERLHQRLAEISTVEARREQHGGVFKARLRAPARRRRPLR